ncbi:hypothetical protein AVEN_231056-1 [Araneus ventricosus]|uniref:Uncharacterized protein n=1 Tax=Araneus ventricosus TaxID=182803 RepID=A0A4Y2A311_ARAVE|nr:hypothetical protein AVEN_231056-1 [Araneus ventricosus]
MKAKRDKLDLSSQRRTKMGLQEDKFSVDVVILNRDQVIRTAPELATPIPTFRATAAGERLALNRFYMSRTFIKGNSWKLVSELQPSGPEEEIVLRGHRDFKIKNGPI